MRETITVASRRKSWKELEMITTLNVVKSVNKLKPEN